jgi:protein O-mannosyl-transferase
MAKKPNVVTSKNPNPQLGNINTAKVDSNLPIEQQNIAADPNAGKGILHILTKGIVPYLIIAALGLICYASTFKHELALDDDIVICKNEFVLRGVAGIPDIFTHDLFESFYRQMNTKAQLTGGRYRPFSVATFALEQQFIGVPNTKRFSSKCWDANNNGVPDVASEDMNRDMTVNEEDCWAMVPFDQNSWDLNKNGKGDAFEDITKDGAWNDRDCRNRGMAFRHVNNVIIYIISIALMFFFLSSFYFKENKWLALLISLMFLAHPLHTEVVANVKSRDEILSLMFMLLAMHNSFRFYETKNKMNLIWAGLTYFIALMSKEYGATLLVIVPIALATYNRRLDLGKQMPILLTLAGTFLVYYLCRSSVVFSGHSDLQGTELLNNPYKLATDDELWPSKLFINIKYAFLLLFPHPLSCDYSYRVIPYKTFADVGVLSSVSLLIVAGVSLAKTSLRLNWLAMPIAFALLHLMLVNNTIFDIGASMGERLVYHTSFGTCILVCFGVWYLFNKYLPNASAFYALPLLAIIAGYTYLTMKRAPQWKNDISLHLTDVVTYPESTMLNGNACTRLIELSEFPVNKDKFNKLLDSAKIYGKKSLELHPDFVNSFLNMGIIYHKQGRLDSAGYYWAGVKRLYPHHPQLPAIEAALSNSNMNRAYTLAQQGKTEEGLQELMKVFASNPTNISVMKDIASFNFTLKRYDESKKYMNMVLAQAPADSLMNRLKSVIQTNNLAP